MSAEVGTLTLPGALLIPREFPKVYGGSFLVHMVVEHTGEAGVGLA